MNELTDADLRETPPCPACGHREHLADVCEQDLGEFGECRCADYRSSAPDPSWTEDAGRQIKVTPAGALAVAFSDLIKDAEGGKSWWRTSPLLSAVGLAHHLDELGWTLVRKTDDTPPDSWTEAEGYVVAPLDWKGAK